jgi:hypothetical protein
MLTEKQKYNLQQLDTEDLIEIMHVCAERIGMVTADQYSIIHKKPRRTVYAGIESGRIKTTTICGHKLPIINI